jgi:hypothetical protein
MFSEIYCAAPATLNDPLDCSPELIFDDISILDLEKLCTKMLLGRCEESQAKKRFSFISAAASEYGDIYRNNQASKEYSYALTQEIKSLFYDEMNQSGVCSLSEDWSCPLMWSHYADQHRGICIKYDTRDQVFGKVYQVHYDKPRNIRLRDLFKWKIQGDSLAEVIIREAFFSSKAPEWKYEKEWRILGSANKVVPHALRISAVYFGMRCDNAIKGIICNALTKDNSEVEFFDVIPDSTSFDLRSQQRGPDLMSVPHGPCRRARSA